MGENTFDIFVFSCLILGGFFITAGAGALNQILEIAQDKKMTRTANRPLVQGLISVPFAIGVAIIYSFLGMFFLYQLDFLVFIFGVLSLVLYAFVYTPLKKHTTWAVLVGAIPGAFPPILGYVAGTHTFNLTAGILFFVQFMWQFPHFWAIAWVSFADYQKANYYLLPLPDGKTKENAFVILIYTFMLIPASLLLWIFPQHAPFLSDTSAFLVAIMGLVFFYYAFQLYLHPNDQQARKLMFMSFVYLPIIQILYIFHHL